MFPIIDREAPSPPRVSTSMMGAFFFLSVPASHLFTDPRTRAKDFRNTATAERRLFNFSPCLPLSQPAAISSSKAQTNSALVLASLELVCLSLRTILSFLPFLSLVYMLKEIEIKTLFSDFLGVSAYEFVDVVLYLKFGLIRLKTK